MSFSGTGPDPKPTKRVRDADALRAAHQGEHACRVCGASGWIEIHHLIGGKGRSDVAENLVALCPRCHLLVEKRDYVTRSALRWKLRPREIAYLIEQRSADWLDVQYPLVPPTSGSRWVG